MRISCAILTGMMFFLAANFVAAEEAETPQWVSLFNGENLDGWKIADYYGTGKVAVEDGIIRLGLGMMITGITYDSEKEFPKTDFEIELESQRTTGTDFFATVTLPVGDGFCSFVTGGWGGSIFGLSSINGYDASENSYTKCLVSENDKWYKIRIRVTEKRILCWVDDEELINCERDEDKKFTTRFEVRTSQPMGIANYCCDSEVKNVRYRMLREDEQ